MSALPALPWGRAPSPPPKRARTDTGAGEDAAAVAPSVWAGLPFKVPSCYGLAAGARLEARPSRQAGPCSMRPRHAPLKRLPACFARDQVAWDCKFDGDEAAGAPPRMFTKARPRLTRLPGLLACLDCPEPA